MANENKSAAEVEEKDDFDFGKGAGEGGQGGAGGDKGGSEGSSKGGTQGATGAGGEGNKGQEGKKEGEGKEGEVAEGGSGKKEGGKGEGAEGTEGEGSEIDIFGEAGESGSAAGQTTSFNYKEFGQELGLELESDDPDEFKTKFNSKLEEARQELKLDDYSEEARSLIKHLKDNGGTVEDFLNNRTIVSLQSVLNSEPEDKVYQMRVGELLRAGVAQDKAEEQADKEVEEMTNKQIRDIAGKLDTDARKLIKDEITKITGDKNKEMEGKRNNAVAQAKKEMNSIRSYIAKQTEFLGIPLTEKAKKAIERDIETGQFDITANKTPEQSKFSAYMMGKFGTQILKTIKEKEKEENRQGYNAASDKHVGALHKTGEAGKQNSSGHQKAGEQGKGKFDGFKDAFGED